jgi:glycine/D-amino acid oxidase-like deaminating enzyme
MSSGSPDVAVIGAGIIGVSVAEELASAGASVTVYEASAVAAAASGRNSGVVQYPLDPVLEELHRGSLERYRRLADEEPEIFRMAATPNGLLLVGRDVARLRAMTDELAATHPQLRAELVPPGDLTRRESAIAEDIAACRLDMGYPVAPASATRAIAARAERAGARFEIGEPARLRVDDERATGVAVGDRFEAAGAVVVAAGPWSPEVVDPSGTWRPIRRMWGVVVQVDLPDPPVHVLEEAGVDIEPGAAPVAVGRAVASPDFSLATAGGASTLGSTFLPDEPDPDALVPRLVAHGSTFVPAIAGAPLGPTRACARPLSVDGRPLIGRVPGFDGLWIAAGHGPWGISTGPASGRVLADLVLGRVASPPAALDPARFGAPPLD